MFILVLLAMSFTSLPTSSATNTTAFSSKLSTNISSAPSLPILLLHDYYLVVEVLMGLPAAKATLFLDITSPFTFVPQNYRFYSSHSSSDMYANDSLCIKPLITDLDEFCRYTDGERAKAALYLFDFFLNLDVTKAVPFAVGVIPGGRDLLDVDGILGLGSGHPVSLVEQLSNTTKGRFSYCIPTAIMQLGSTSRGRGAPTLDFGNRAAISGEEWNETILLHGPTGGYYLKVTAILVDERPLVVKPEVFWPNRSGGGFILHSMVAFTQLLPHVYDSLKQALVAYFWYLYKVDPISEPSKVHLDLCYNLSDFRRGEGGFERPEFKAPSIHIELEFGKALLKLPNTFLAFPESNVICLMITPLSDRQDKNLLGTVQQAGHRFVIDVPRSTLTFAPNQC